MQCLIEWWYGPKGYLEIKHQNYRSNKDFCIQGDFMLEFTINIQYSYLIPTQ